MKNKTLFCFGIFVLTAIFAGTVVSQGPRYTTWSALDHVSALSLPGVTEYANCISHDGQRFYFMRGGDIYVAHRRDQDPEWGDIVKLPDTVNTTATENNAFETTDGHWLYFGSTRPGGLGGSDIWVSWRKNVKDDLGWQPAVNLAAVNTPGFENGPMLFENHGAFQLYFAASPPCQSEPCPPGAGTQAGADIYMSKLGPNGFDTPQLVPGINDSTHHDGKPYVRRDGLELIFESYRLGPSPMSTGGAIFVTTRSSVGQPWGVVRRVMQGPSVGSGLPGDRWITTPVLSGDDETLIVAVNEPGTDFGDIYVSHRRRITGHLPHFDFDGDGKTDVSVFRPSEGVWYLNQSTAGFAAVNWGIETDRIVPADYDGDGKADFAVWRPSANDMDADFHVLNSNDFTYAGYSFGLPGDIPMVGDFHGDRQADIAVYRPSTGVWWLLDMATQGVSFERFGTTGDIPLVMDNDGDGKDHMTVYRPGEHYWYIRNLSNNADAIKWGLETDIFVPADYDGDGNEDVAVFRPSDGYWYILRSSDGGHTFAQFGAKGDIPVPGDYDGDGKVDLAVYRGGMWYINGSTTGFRAESFGFPTDKPVPAAYLP